MISVMTCLAARHDPWLVALAGLFCCIGAWVSARLAQHAFAATRSVKIAWLSLSALVIGTAVWTTHFIAIVAYLPEAPSRVDPYLTIVSLLIGICGAFVALAISSMDRHRSLPAIGGALLGLSVAAVHYTGMLAYQLDGDVRWRSGFVVASVVLAVVLGALTLMTARAPLKMRFGRCAAPALLAATILSLHFTGMTSLEVVPFGNGFSSGVRGVASLAIATTIAGALVILAGCFCCVIDARNLVDASQHLAAMARTDALTALPNRGALDVEISSRIAARQAGEDFALIIFEIADLDAINQQFGARIGDVAVQNAANRLREACESGIFLARASGAQFFAVGRVEDRADMMNLARSLYFALSRELVVEAIDLRLDMRLGGAMFPGDADDPDELMRKALAALARAKADPLAPIAFHDEVSDANSRRSLAVAKALHGALDRGEFELHYQPQVRIPDRTIIGYEALLRWKSPELGMVSPCEFIPLAERTGSIVAIGGWALHTACAEATHWPEAIRVAVNISPLQLRQADLPEQVNNALINSGLSPDRLEIELTESLLIEDRHRALRVFQQIKGLGVRLALDDFGAGYSSLEILRLFPFDKVKLDKSLVNNIETNPQSRAILHAMLELGRKLSMPVLVEGVETDRQLAVLREEGCNKVQGYLTGRPTTAAALLAAFETGDDLAPMAQVA